MAKVTFDGPNKLIIVDSGITELDVQVDLYSDWKEWAATGTNLKYPDAFRTIGGDPVGAKNFGRAFFLRNGWKIRPHEADHDLVFVGNLFLDDGESGGLTVPTLGGFTVLGVLQRSLDVFGVEGVAAEATVAAVKAKTDALPASPASETTVASALSAALRATGLLHENAVIDQQTWEGDQLKSARLRCYNSKANAQAGGAAGLWYEYTIEAEYAAGKLARYSIVREQ